MHPSPKGYPNNRPRLAMDAGGHRGDLVLRPGRLGTGEIQRWTMHSGRGDAGRGRPACANAYNCHQKCKHALNVRILRLLTMSHRTG